MLEADERRTAQIPVQREQLAGLIEALLREIAAALGGAGRSTMTKITADHLARGAFCLSSASRPPISFVHNQEERGQYGLAGGAKELGWAAGGVVDDDLGRSGGGVARPGFERLLAAICSEHLGAVFAIEASRLARNGRDWHTLIELSGLVGTVVVDEDGIYDALGIISGSGCLA